MLVANPNQNGTWEYPNRLQAVPSLQNKFQKLAYVAESTGKRIELVSSVLDYDISRASPNRHLATFTSILEQAAQSEQQGWQPDPDPFFCMWGIRNAFRAVSLPRPNLQQRPLHRGTPAYAALAARLCIHRHGDKGVDRIHRGLLHEIRGGPAKTASHWQVREAHAWRTLYAYARQALPRTGTPITYCPDQSQLEQSQLPCRSFDADFVYGGLRPDQDCQNCLRHETARPLFTPPDYDHRGGYDFRIRPRTETQESDLPRGSNVSQNQRDGTQWPHLEVGATDADPQLTLFPKGSDPKV